MHDYAPTFEPIAARLWTDRRAGTTSPDHALTRRRPGLVRRAPRGAAPEGVPMIYVVRHGSRYRRSAVFEDRASAERFAYRLRRGGHRARLRSLPV
jgi:hypothetical protein